MGELKPTLHITNAIFALGSARRKLLEQGDAESENELADITDQLMTIKERLMPDDEDYQEPVVKTKASGTTKASGIQGC